MVARKAIEGAVARDHRLRRGAARQRRRTGQRLCPARRGRAREPAVRRDDDLSFASVDRLGQLLRAGEITATAPDRARPRPPRNGRAAAERRRDDRQRNAPSPRPPQADAELADGRDRGPLHGIPYGAKDLLSTVGAPTTWGAAPFRDQVIDEDAAVVERLREAGAVLVAKLAMVEIAGGFGYDQPERRLDRPRPATPGDATPGPAARPAAPASAVGAGCVPFAIGSETFGSITLPAAVLRHQRVSAQLRRRQPARRDGPLLDDGQDRTDGPLGRRLRARPRRDRRPRPGRPVERRPPLATAGPAGRRPRLAVLKDAHRPSSTGGARQLRGVAGRTGRLRRPRRDRPARLPVRRDRRAGHRRRGGVGLRGVHRLGWRRRPHRPRGSLPPRRAG